jgi:hypothetical protein
MWSVDLIARRFVRGDKRLIVLLLLLLLPAYDFHAQRFNANSILLAIWPLATYAFLRSFEERTTLWSMLAGALGALAMLGKYFSVFLLVGFCFAAICHPRRARYFGSRAPWISILAGLTILSPHIHWLWANRAPTFHYGLGHAFLPVAESISDVAKFFLGIAGFMILPTMAWLAMIHFRWREWLRGLDDLNESLWLLILIFAGSALSAGITALALSSSLPAIWHLQGLFLLIVPAICATRFPIDRIDVTNLFATVTSILLVVLIASPFHALYRNRYPLKEGRNYYHRAAAILTQHWRSAFGTSLREVGGDEGLALAVAFYSPDHPRFSQISRSEIGREALRKFTASNGNGWSALCFADDPGCMAWMEQISRNVDGKRRFEFEPTQRFLGYPGTPRRIAAIMVPPFATRSAQPEGRPNPRRDTGARIP